MGHPPRVVLVRPTDVTTDSRAKKIAVSLARHGYDVTVLGRSSTEERRHGTVGQAAVLLTPPRSRVRGRPASYLRLPLGRPGRVVQRRVNLALQRAERRMDNALRRRVDRQGSYLWHAAQRDFRMTYGSELLNLRPDVVHVHDPRLLPTAFVVAATRRERGGQCRVVYDAREDFAGWHDDNVTLVRYHEKLLAMEQRLAKSAAAVLTVSDGIAEALTARLALPQPPAVVLNTPALDDAEPAAGRRSLRADAGIGPDVPLLVYPGAATEPRGVDSIVAALTALPGVHLALVVVPFPHPRAEELMGLAGVHGVADRVHLLPPVPGQEVPGYIREADVAVSAILHGSDNHEMALPNKLFEFLHAGLPMVTSDIRAMAAFVREHRLGEVFRAGDSGDLAAAVRRLLAAPGDYADADARRALAERYSWQAQERVLVEVYGRVAPVPGEVEAARPSISGPYPSTEVVWD